MMRGLPTAIGHSIDKQMSEAWQTAAAKNIERTWMQGNERKCTDWYINAVSWSVSWRARWNVI